MHRGVLWATAILAVAACGFVGMLGNATAEPAVETWAAKRIYDAFHNETRCAAETPKQVINDGYQNTAVFLRMDGRSLAVMTESNLDLRQGDVGIRVDGGALIRPDRVFLDQNAVFETEIGNIIGQFKPGLKADVYLRFWPTWPSKGLKTVRFSLLGFTQAFARLPGC